MLLGFGAGVFARVMMPGDVFRRMGGPKSWGISILIGVAGALLGWVIFTLGMGIGDDYIFDWGGILGAVIGAMIVLAIANWYFRRQTAPAAALPPPPTPPSAEPPTPPAPPV